jgi:hypothetical protein
MASIIAIVAAMPHRGSAGAAAALAVPDPLVRRDGGAPDLRSAVSHRLLQLGPGAGIMEGGNDSHNNTTIDQRMRLLEFQTDIEMAEHTTIVRRREGHHVVEQILDAIGDLLRWADRGLDGLDDDLLGTALMRGCHELADAIGGLAE